MTTPAYRLPTNIEIGSRFGPTFNNVIQEAIAGNEQRFGRWTKCRGVGDLSYGLLTSSTALGDYQAILALYLAHNGSLFPFRFKPWGDCTATDETFGTGDGSTVSFQLIKTYDPGLILLNTTGGRTYVRTINLLSTTPVIKVDGVTKTVVTDYNISASGLVTFTSAPANTKLCKWTGEFDVLVRFDGDLPLVMKESDIASIGSITIKEVIGE